MNDKECHDARREAVRDLTADPQRPHRHEDDIADYLAVMAYAELRQRRSDKPQPVDEPAPYSGRTGRRRRSRRTGGPT